MINEILYIDCISGMKKYVGNETVDLFYADAPFGIDF